MIGLDILTRLTQNLSFSWGIGIEILLLIFLAFLSGSEAAILAVNKLRVRQDAESGIKGAKILGILHSRREDFLSSLLALETILTVAISTIGTALAAGIRPGAEALFLAAILIALCVLVLGEIIPKTIATGKPDRFSYLAAPFILALTNFFSVFLRPLTWTLSRILKRFGSLHAHPLLTEKELKYLISLSREHGIINQEEEELLQNIFDFADSRVGEMMIPRTQIVSLEENETVREALDKFASTGYSRFTVHSKDLDHIVGFVDVRDILLATAKGETASDLKKLIRPVVFIPESKRVGKLFAEMRKENFTVAVVVDEYGGTAGFVTLTDLVQEIVGKLNEPSPGNEIKPLDEKTLIVPASAKLEEIEERFNVSFNEKKIQTIGGLVFSLFGRVPEQGEQIRYQNLRLTVAEKDGYKISKVMIAKEGR